MWVEPDFIKSHQMEVIFTSYLVYTFTKLPIISTQTRVEM